MAAAARVDSKRLYSWWWDSHISPKNSKWLQENLTDMDAKVKQMIKLIEEDADSFARRAEMYYKKRPELMKLVEEFYRAYRALAERYDNATGVLRQAHRTMTEVFPNQVPLVLADDSPAGSATEADPHTPEMPPPIRALFEPDELQKDSLGRSPSHFSAVKKNGGFTDEPDSVTSRKGSKQFNNFTGSGEAANRAKFAEGRVRKGLNFHDAEEKEQSEPSKESHDFKARSLSESERVGKTEMEILSLKKALAKLEAEKEAGLLQYQQSLERLSNLESQVSRAQDDSRGLNERAGKAEAEVLTLKDALTKLEVERETNLLQYQQCMDKISDLENTISNSQKVAGELDELARKAEIEGEALKQDLARVEAERENALAQYKQCLDMASILKEKIQHAEQVAREIGERADKAESEVETLKQALARVTEEKEAAAVQYHQCLETISSLENKLSCALEEAQRLNSEIDNGVTKLKDAEERCLLLVKSNQTLQSELEASLQKIGTQSEELTEKQQELGRLWTCVQEERLRFIEAETAFQTLQHLHSQSQEELRSLAAELLNRAQILKDMETHNQGLQDEVQKVKEENKGLNELNLSSAMSMKNFQDEILSLRETVRKLEQEVELRVDQRNALQQEIYCLKEELNDLSKKYQAMQAQVDSVGLDPECFGSSVKELQDENTKLKENCDRDRSEKVALMEKLEIMEKVIEKNSLLENSLSDLNLELEGVRGKVKALEEFCQSLQGDKFTLAAEKATLISQLQLTIQNLEKLTGNNSFLENSLADANAELEGLRVNSKSLEDSCLLLGTEKSSLISERERLTSQLDISRQNLQDLEKRYTEIEEKLASLEKERQCTLREVEELRVSLDAEKQEHASFVQLSEARLAGLELQIGLLQDECQCRKKEYEEEADKAVITEIEIFILQKCVQDLEEKNFFLLIEYQKVLEASKLSRELISELEHENLAQQMEVKSLFDQISILRMGLCQVVKTLDHDANHGSEGKDKIEQDQTLLNQICVRIQDTQNSLFEIWDENQLLVIEKSVLVTLLGQLKLEATNIATERNTLDQNFRIQSEQFSHLQIESQKLIEMNEELRLRAMEGNHKEEVLTTEIENLRGELLGLQGAYQNLLEENYKVIEEKRSMMKEILDLGEAKHKLEEENCVIFGETTYQSNLSLIFKETIAEKSVELKELSENLDKLQFVNKDLVEKVKIMESKLEDEIANGKVLLDLQGAYQNLLEENCKVIEERRSLTKEVLDLGEAKHNLEEENCVIFSEAICQSNLSLIFKETIAEKSVELKELSENLDKLRFVNNDLVEKVKIMQGKLEDEIANGKVLLDLQGAYQNLLEENCKVIEEKRSLTKEVLDLGKAKHNLEEENCVIFSEAICQSNLSLIFKETIAEKSVELKELGETLDKLQFVNNDLVEKVKIMEGKLEDEIANGKDLLDLQGAYQNLLEENCKVIEEKRSLTKEVLDLGEAKHNLEVENCVIFGEAICQSNLSLIFKETVAEKSVELKELGETLAKLRFVNNDLVEKVKIMEGKLEDEIANGKDLLDLQGAYQNLLEENCKVIEEKRSLTKEVSDLGEAKHNLEVENCVILGEAICQSNLSLIFKEIIAEKSVELTELSENLDKLRFVNGDLVEKVKIMEGKLEDEIANGKDLLCQKENELLEAERMLSAMQNEKTELHGIVEDLRCKYDEVNLIREDQGKKILKLSEDYDHQSKEFEGLRETNLKMDAELRKLCEEFEETKKREESLSYELKKGRNEVELWETQASTFFGELLISAFGEALFKGKIHELAEACKSFEDESNSKGMEIGLLRERFSTLEGENGGLKAQLAAYIPAVISLRDCIASLENRTLLHVKPHKAIDQAKDVTSVSDLHAVSSQHTSEDPISMVPDGFSDLQDLQMRIIAIEKAVMESERLAMLENLNVNAKLEAATRQVEELKSGTSLRPENVQTSKRLTTKRVDDESGDGLSNDVKQRKQRHEISEVGNEILPKDIMLDHISDCSSYGISRRENTDANDQMLELWETTDQDGSVDLTAGKAQKVAITPNQQTEAVKQHKSANPSTESVIVKELGVDKLEISNRFTEPREEGNKRKILERLDSDLQKLTNLQITVQDLKRKVEITENSKKGKGIEYDTVKEQLEEAEEAIVQLFDVNRKLMKNAEDCSLSSDGISAIESDESGSVRRKVSEQARRGSEKIGRLQLEVQKLQFLLLKLDDEKESRGRTKITERKTRVLLRDYIYGGSKTGQKKKKMPFCACIRPPTKGD